jgi:hypothetical protein
VREEERIDLVRPRITRRVPSWAWLLVFVFPLLLYAGSLGVDFLMDDETIITANTRLAPGQGPLEIFRRPEQFADFTLPYYRPLVNVSYWVDRRLWGSNASGFHFTNLLLHWMATLLVFTLARALMAEPLWAALAALLFAAHPIHTESVIMVQGRTDLLGTVLVSLSLLALLRALQATDGARILAAGVASGVALLAALLSKEMAITWPALAALTVVAYPNTSKGKTARIALLCSVGAAALGVYFWMRGAVTGGALPVDFSRIGTPGLGLVPITFVTYLGLLVWPFSFSFIRSISPPETWADPRILVSAILASAILLSLALLTRRNRVAAAGAGWMVITLLPVLNLFPIPGFVVAERYLYLPSVGFCLLLAAWIRRAAFTWATSKSHLALAAAVLLLLVAFTATIQVRAIQWQDPVGVFEFMARRTPNSFFVQNNLGLEYLSAGETQRAVDTLLRARELEPSNPAVWNNLGVALRRSGRLSEARSAFEWAIAMNPGYAQAYENFAELLAAQGDQAGARRVRERAQAIGAR